MGGGSSIFSESVAVGEALIKDPKHVWDNPAPKLTFAFSPSILLLQLLYTTTSLRKQCPTVPKIPPTPKLSFFQVVGSWVIPNLKDSMKDFIDQYCNLRDFDIVDHLDRRLNTSHLS